MPNDEPQKNDDPWNDFARELGADVPEDDGPQAKATEVPEASDETSESESDDVGSTPETAPEPEPPRTHYM